MRLARRWPTTIAALAHVLLHAGSGVRRPVDDGQASAAAPFAAEAIRRLGARGRRRLGATAAAAALLVAAPHASVDAAHLPNSAFLDLDGDGLADAAEYKACITHELDTMRAAYGTLGSKPLDDAKELHAWFDKNDNGMVDNREFAEEMLGQTLEWGWGGKFHEAEVAAWTDEIWAIADVDVDGSLSPRELKYAYLMFEYAMRYEQVLSLAFGHFDADKNGIVDWEEFQRAYVDVNERQLDPEEHWFFRGVFEILATSDADGDGELSKAEAGEFMSRVLLSTADFFYKV